ncbi:hypothetical protein VC03_02870 [Sneathia vaginalis]|uniref:Uncharacterized protein n=1 Tax=Sneathia vaginalis TaxID=187101 RepID=A0A0E3ZA86_9FUSO|nr:hypothetical protein [Sneathia vaginalis]AKC95477.1 hypothetical protein VC03_02870 [Sneathia vaginalis]
MDKEDILAKAKAGLVEYNINYKNDNFYFDLIDSVIKDILDYINQDELPPNIIYIVVERLKGYILEDTLLNLSKDEVKNIYGIKKEDNNTISSVKIGGISTTFSDKSSESSKQMQYFSDLKKQVIELKDYGIKQLSRYRRISWW